MTVSREDIEHLSKLARIALSEEEVLRLGKDINNILRYVEQVSGVSNDASSSRVENVYNVLREDENPDEPSQTSNELLESAPETVTTERGTYVKVGKIL